MATSKWKKRALLDILKNERMITYSEKDDHSADYLEQYNLHRKLSRKKTYTNDSRIFQRQLQLGLGFGLLPMELSDRAVDQGKLVILNEGRSLRLPISLAWYHRREMPGYMKEIVQIIG